MTWLFARSILLSYSRRVSVALTLLGLLEREPSYGYDLKRDYDAHFARGKPLSFGQVYTTLSRLARDGKAIAGPPEQGDGPERKRYSITPAGAAEVDSWLARPAEPSPHLQPELFAKVTLALMLGRPAGKYLDAQRTAHLRRMRELTRLKDAGTLTDTLLADYGLFHLEADLRWIELTAARLNELREETLR
jgi:DNA-binding PadR family transcriptional regulator